MELKEWCSTLRKEFEALSPKTTKAIPYMAKELLAQCEKAAAGEPDSNANVKIALVGTFSSGKSSFLNAVFDRDLTAVDINQTTRCRTDFTFGPRFCITSVRNGKEFSTEEYQQISKIGHAKEDSHYLALLPDPRLDGILFIDTPGFDPPQDRALAPDQQDAAISRRAAEDADVVFFLIETKDGTVREDCLEYMRQLNERTASACNHPLRLVVILNKADLKMPSARLQIVDEVKSICKENKINVERFILHTSRKPKKNSDFYQQCQNDIWALVKKYQEEKKLIVGARRGVWAQLSRQSLVDLRDILVKFTDFQTCQLEKQESKLQGKTDEKINEKSSAIAELLKSLVLDFAYSNRRRYSSKYRVEKSGIFGWDWTKDWRAYITQKEKNVIPNGDDRDEIRQKIFEQLEVFSIPSPDIYAERLLEDIDHMLLSVFKEDDGTQHYMRCGRHRTCAVESEANEQVVTWQNEFINALEEKSDEFFEVHVKNALSSLLKLEDAQEKQMLANDLRILKKISNLLYLEFPALHEKSSFQHPVLEMSLPLQRKYIALLNSAKINLEDSPAQRLLDEMQKLCSIANIGFSSDELEMLGENENNFIFSEPTDWNTCQKSDLLVYALADVGFADPNPEDEKKILALFGNLPLFHDIDMNSQKGFFVFGTYTAEAKDEKELSQKAIACKEFPLKWSYLLINRGFDAGKIRRMEAAVPLFGWQGIANMFKSGNFTQSSEDGLFLENCMFRQNFAAADFLIEHGCDVCAVSGDGNVINNLNIRLTDETFSYLLDHGVSLSKEAWSTLFLMNKDSLIAIATSRAPEEVPPESIFQSALMMNLETLKAYGDNGGKLDIYSEEDGCSLIDCFIRFDNNDLVEYMRSRGFKPSPDAKSTHQILDELFQS